MTSNTLITLLGMALVTYMVRAGGLWLMGFVKPSPRMEAWFKAIPGAVLVSLVAPTVLTSGLAEMLAALATILVAVCTKKMLLAIVGGVAVVWALRRIF